MASISSLGIGSGILTSELIEKLANAEREPIEKRLKAKEEALKTQISDFGKLQSAVTDLRLISRTLGNPAALAAKSATSSSSSIAVTAGTSASTQQFSMTVSKLAQSHSLATGVFDDQDKTALGTGKITIKSGDKTKTIELTNGNNTLQGLAKEINGAKLGISASVINTGNGYQLVMNTENTGADNAIEISVEDDDGSHLDTNGLSRLAFNAYAQNLDEKIEAQDAEFAINGITIKRASNTVSDVIEGLTFTLTDEVTAPATIKVGQDADAVAQRVQDFIDKFNEIQTIINEVGKYKPGGESGSLAGNSAVRAIYSQSRAILGSVIQGLEGANIRSLAEVGISTNSETGIISFDKEAFKKGLRDHESDVVALFAEQGRTSDTQVEFVRAGLNTKVGEYDIQVTRLATQGQLTATTGLSGNTVINAGNNGFKIKIDGVESNLIELTENASGYSNAEFVEELKRQINADTNLSAKGISVEVGLDADNKLVFTSATYGSKSNVEFTYVDNGEAQPATSGQFTGTIALPEISQIELGNGDYEISVDGVTSGPISLEERSYTRNDLVAAFQAQLDADTSLQAAGVSVTVGLDDSNRLTFTSNSTGVSSSVAFTSVGPSSALSLGIEAGAGISGQDAVASSDGVLATWGVDAVAGTAGLDVAGTINGKAATGSGQTLTAASGDDAEGVQVKITGGTTGARGKVTYIEGIGDQFVDLINNFLDKHGVITATNEGFNKQLALIAQQRAQMNTRIENLTTRLAKQFTAADIMVSRLQNTQNFIKSQMAALVGGNKDD